jgi:SAM-dependent methyltransferase
MTQSLAERLRYHPDPRTPEQADRRTQPRVELIRDKVDCAGKVVVDLGCSGGLFSFELAKVAKRVIAVDGDAEVIARNLRIQRELGITNIEFIHSPIDAALIRRLGPVDVVLMLSVFHHILTQSAAYGWNEGATQRTASDIIDAVGEAASVLVFEIGYPNEGYEWCERLPDFGSDWDDYVRRTIFRDRFASVEVHEPRAPIAWFNRRIVSRLSRPYREDGRFVQRIKSALRFDPRDLRRVYIGRKAPAGPLR